MTQVSDTLRSLSNLWKDNVSRLLPAIAVATIAGGVTCCAFTYLWRKAAEPFQLLKLPQEVRRAVLQCLSYHDLLTMRTVCKQLQEDVDFRVGLVAHVHPQKRESHTFFQRVALRKCRIRELTDSLSSLLIRPTFLQELTVTEQIFISLENLDRLLTGTDHLKKLHLLFGFNSHLGEEGTSLISKLLLKHLKRNTSLRQLRVVKKSRQNGPFISKLFSVKKGKNLLSHGFPRNLIKVNLELPDINGSELHRWLLLLKEQQQLRALNCDFGTVHWEIYSPIIQTCSNSLQDIILSNLKSRDQETFEQRPLDWAIFKDCLNLKSLSLTSEKYDGAYGSEMMSSKGFEEVPCKNMEFMYVHRIEMTPEDIRKVFTEMTKLTTSYFDEVGEEAEETVREMLKTRIQTEYRNINRQQQLRNVMYHGVFIVVLSISAGIFWYANETAAYDIPHEFTG